MFRPSASQAALLSRYALQNSRSRVVPASLRGFHTTPLRSIRPSAVVFAANPQSGKPASDSWKVRRVAV